MNDLYRVKLWSQAVYEFETEFLPLIQAEYEKDGRPDIIARCQEWSNWTDSLCKNREISDWQYENWSFPPCCEG